jgi:hypothetical protein
MSIDPSPIHTVSPPAVGYPTPDLATALHEIRRAASEPVLANLGSVIQVAALRAGAHPAAERSPAGRTVTAESGGGARSAAAEAAAQRRAGRRGTEQVDPPRLVRVPVDADERTGQLPAGAGLKAVGGGCARSRWSGRPTAGSTGCQPVGAPA